jgi:hypothetical protein
MRAAATTAVVAGTATAVSGRVARRQQAAAQPPAEAPPAAAPEAPMPPPAAPPSSTGLSADAIERLKELAALQEQGVLTEEEFAAQKAKILGS